MIPPKAIRIDGKRWTIRTEALPEGTHGLTDFEARKITLSPNLKDADEVLLHEILHACIGPEVDLYMPDEMDELLVTLLAPRLLGVLKQMGVWK